ncbi:MULTISPECIES: RSP_7527 family protein [Falsihalocynthiibacter]|uniref:RSP_7527 family protein n=1 Tax=Falsihalocynthiibacter TaxID=2854182 RepID=UPI00300177A8
MALVINNNTKIDMFEIEKRARALRAQATRDMVKAIGAFVSRLVHSGAAKPVATSA